MQRIIDLLLLMALSITGHCQCEGLIFIDSSGHELDSVQASFNFDLNHESNTIYLDDLYDLDLTHGYGWFEPVTNSLKPVDVALQEDEVIPSDPTHYCAQCLKEDVQIIDSIDINHDGIKELFILREWNCSVSPPIPGPYGVGTQQQRYTLYEVWDANSKEKVFSVKNTCENHVAITVNVGKKFGYSFEVKIDKEGSFYLSNLSGMGNELEMGNYVFDSRTKNYVKH